MSPSDSANENQSEYVKFSDKYITDKIMNMESAYRDARTKHQRLTHRYRVKRTHSLLLQRCNKEVAEENERLSSGAEIVWDVIETTGDGEMILKHSGDNREIITEIPDRMANELTEQDRVTTDEEGSVQTNIPTGSGIDPVVSKMEVIESPAVTFDDIGGLRQQKRELKEVIGRIRDDTMPYGDIGITPPTGALLYGPPGTGKTLLAKAAAQESSTTFITLAGSELLSKFVGGGPQRIKQLFQYARDNAPAVVFIDEIDAIGQTRQADGPTQAVERTLAQLLTELDGFDTQENITTIGATNRPDILDSALTRPGRLDREIAVPLPNRKERADIFTVQLESVATGPHISPPAVADQTDGYSGADIANVVTKAGLGAIRDDRTTVTMDDLQTAVTNTDPTGNSEQEYVLTNRGHR